MRAVGPFVLREPLGRGGMGEVWRAEHAPTGHPVAVKLVASAHASHPALRAAFRREVRAVAALDHPGVVRVYDQGLVGPEEAAAAPALLQPGAPWLAMELSRGGSLAPWCGRLPWARIHALLDGLLEALAHAHAAGVLHRDVKPANVLLRGDPLVDAAPVLSDFGLAHARRSAQAAESGRLSAGTPGFMAPEQAAAAWRDQGPWTDLYAVGRMAWALVTGGPLAVPQGRLPEAYEAWVARCTWEDPAGRFSRASDARRALAEVPPLPPEAIGGASPVEGLSASTLAWSDPGTTAGSTLALEGPGEGPPPARQPRARPMAAPPLALTPDWREVEPPLRPAPLRGAGLGLVGLRPVPLVGREPERDRLWSALRATLATRRPRAVLLRGPAGVGKSRLARWLALRAHEQGAAAVLEAVHGEVGGPTDGPIPMLLHALGLAGLAPREAMGALATWLRAQGEPGTYAWRALGTALGVAGDQAVVLRSAEQRLQILARAVVRLGGDRAAICWLDDAQWGGDARALARTLLGWPGEAPVLVVLTARDEALAEAPEAEAELLALPELEVLPLGPLAPVQARQAVGAIAGLDHQVVQRLVERTGGNPLFAIQLVRDWVERGVLVPGEGGYALPAGASLSLPDDLHQTWLHRVDRLLRRVPAEAGPALERAAALGAEVRGEEWAAACEVDGVWAEEGLLERLLDALLDQNLAVPRAGGGAAWPREASADWAFVHGMLRESLLRRAAEAGRSAAHHRACAAVLAGPEHALRRSRHAEAAGDLEPALEALLEGAEHALVASRHLGLADLVSRGEELATRQGLAPDAPLRLRLDSLRVRVRRIIGDFAGTVDLADQLLRWLPEGPVRASVLSELGLVLRLWGRHDEARAHLAEAVGQALAAGDLRTALLAEREIAYSWLRGGRVEPAEAAALRAASLAEALGNTLELGETLRLRATLARQRGDVERTRALAGEALPLYEAIGYGAGALDACNMLGDCARYQGDLEAAAAAYQQALEWVSRGELVRRDPFPRMNLALVDLGRHRWQAALDGLEGVDASFVQTGQLGLVAVVEVMRAAGLTGLGREEEARTLLARARAGLEQHGVVEVDVAWVAEVAAAAASRADLAAAWAALAAAQRAAGAGGG